MSARNARKTLLPPEQRTIQPEDFLAYSLDMLVVIKSMANSFELPVVAKSLEPAIRQIQIECYQTKKEPLITLHGGR